jgi:hypothetical protein
MGAAEVFWDLADGAGLPTGYGSSCAAGRASPAGCRRASTARRAARSASTRCCPVRTRPLLVVDEDDGELVLARGPLEVRTGETALVDF